MATQYKILGQAMPTTTSNVDLYTVPSSGQSVVSTVSITNVLSYGVTCRVYVVASGAVAANSNALIFDCLIQANDVNPITIGITLSEGDKITVQSGVANALTFQAFGSEII